MVLDTNSPRPGLVLEFAPCKPSKALTQAQSPYLGSSHSRQNQTQKKGSHLRFPEEGGRGGKLEEGGQKVPTSSYKINEY